MPPPPQKKSTATGRTVVALGLAALAGTLSAAVLLAPGCLDCDGVGFPPPGIHVYVHEEGTNWSVTILTVPSGQFPESTYLEVRNPDGVVTLARTAVSSLTPENWSRTRVLYEDINPRSSAISVADALVLDDLRYGYLSEIRISDDQRVLTTARLQ